MKTVSSEKPLLTSIKGTIEKWFQQANITAIPFGDVKEDCFGKMLRSQLAAFVLPDDSGKWPSGVQHACASVELLHTVSLFHDDVVDGATLRRGKPSLWKIFSQNTAVLFGDILLCEALSRLAASPGARHVKDLLDKGREVCIAEAEQELVLRGSPCDFNTCVRIARGKTGPLFAFVGLVCGGADKALADALTEVGYRVGTAYQLADDIIDEQGDEALIGKTLGTDRMRRKYTLAQDGPTPTETIRSYIIELCESSHALLKDWPGPQAGLRGFLEQVLYPACGPAVASRFALAVPCFSGFRQSVTINGRP